MSKPGALSIGYLYASIGADITPLKRSLVQSRMALKSFNTTHGAALKAMGRKVKMAGLAIAATSVLISAKIIKTGMAFEHSMKTVKGVARATEAEYKALTATAREMGETTEWSARQAAEGMKFLAMAGFDTIKTIKAIPGMLDMATAGNIDLGRAADIATNALTAMRLPVEELSRVSDVFTNTITSSNTNMDMMAESFKYAAPQAKALGYNIEELSAMIGTLGNAGVQGSMAGTQLSFAMQKSIKIAKKLGIEDSNLMNVLGELNKRGYDASEMIQLFGFRGGKAALILRNLIEETRDFTNANKEAQGATKKLADEMRDSLQGRYDILKATIESIALDIFGGHEAELKEGLDSITKWLDTNREDLKAMGDAFMWVAKGMAALTAETVSLAAQGTRNLEQFSSWDGWKQYQAFMDWREDKYSTWDIIKGDTKSLAEDGVEYRKLIALQNKLIEDRKGPSMIDRAREGGSALDISRRQKEHETQAKKDLQLLSNLTEEQLKEEQKIMESMEKARIDIASNIGITQAAQFDIDYGDPQEGLQEYKEWLQEKEDLKRQIEMEIAMQNAPFQDGDESNIVEDPTAGMVEEITSQAELIDDQTTAWEGLKYGIQDASKEMKTFAELGYIIGNSLPEIISSNFGSAFMDFVDGTKSASKAMKDFAKNVLDQLMQMIVTQMIYNAVAGAMSSGTNQISSGIVENVPRGYGQGTSQFGSENWSSAQPRATGGDANSNETYIVGDGGEPEILQMGSRRGFITPFSKMKDNDNPPPTVIVNIKTDRDMKVKQSEPEFDGKRWVVNMFMEGYEENISGVKNMFGGN